MVTSPPLSASFNYWATLRHPHISEAYSIGNGTISDVQPAMSEVNDLRSNPEHFTLDKNGFEFIKHHSNFISPPESSSQPSTNNAHSTVVDVAKRFQNIDFICQEYWPEVCAALREHLTWQSKKEEFSRQPLYKNDPPSLVIPMQTAVRTSEISKFTPPTGPTRMNQSAPSPKIVHNDYSPSGARTVLRSMLPTYLSDIGIADQYSAGDQEHFLTQRQQIIEIEDELIQSSQSTLRHWDGKAYNGPRWAIYSVWRPFETVRRDPIALIDAQSMFELPQGTRPWENTYMRVPIPHKTKVGFVPEYKMVNMTMFTPGLILSEKVKGPYRWYYMKEQQVDDLLIIKLFDSEAWKDRSAGVAPCSAHSAFELEGQTGERPRRSIEVRVLVIW